MNTMIRNTIGAAAVTAMAFAACTGDAGSSLDGTAGQGADTGTGTNVGGGFNPNTGSGTNTGGNENSCGDLQFEPQLIGVDMIVSVDKSGSMDNNNKWNNAEAAFTAFFQSPEADSLGVALKFWPDNSCYGPLCDFDGCANPQVALGPLSDPAHETALISAFNGQGPGGATPMEAALAGATQWALAQQQSSEVGRRVVVVFLTDGEPNGCNENIDVIKSYAADAFASQEILTFAVGLEGSNVSDMNAIAQAGGTSMGYFIGNNNAEQELLDALQAIQEVAVSCTFALPESPDPTKQLDPTKVDITYDPGDGSGSTEIPHVDDAQACDAGGGWYYDDNENPSVIFLCEQTCTLVNDANKPDGKLGLTAGCLIIAE